MTYFILRTLHIIGATVLLGTGAGIGFFAWFGYRLAMRNGSIELLRGVLTLTVIADALFTATTAVIQPITGALLWHMTVNDWQHPWLQWAFVLYTGVGLCWFPVLIIQVRLRDAARTASSVVELQPSYHRLFKVWFALGVPAFLMVVALVTLMVFRPLLL